MRIKELDGLRGISILLVVFFHFYSRWPTLYPYSSNFANISIFKYGSFGVQLFFMISGLVIFMTLDRTKSFIEFIIKRWTRLIPSMFVASVFILVTANFFTHRPIGIPRLIDSIPGLTLIEPYWLLKIFKIQLNSLEGAFWSLYVEFRFYIIFGLAFYFLNRMKSVILLTGISAITFIIKVLINFNFNLPYLKQLDFLFADVLLGNFLFWFLIGIFAYEYLKGEFKKILPIFILTIFGAILYAFIFQSLDIVIVEILCLILFFGLIKLPLIKTILSNKLLLFLGTISYPLYLIHENAGVSMIIDFAQIHFIPQFLLPIISLGILAFITYPYVTYLEPFLQKKIKNLTQRLY